MKLASSAALLIVTLIAPQLLHAQASEMRSGAPPTAAGTADQRGRALIDQMIAALGGQAWLNRTSIEMEGHGSAFFHGEPNPYIIEYKQIERLPGSGKPWARRVGFLTPRGMIMPGKKIDVVQIWTDGHGYEVTYKGKTELPKDQVEEFYRNRDHSIDEDADLHQHPAACERHFFGHSRLLIATRRSGRVDQGPGLVVRPARPRRP